MVDINEVNYLNAVLGQLETQDPILDRKLYLENVFLDMIKGCAVKFDFEKYPEKIFLMKNDEIWFELDYKSGRLWCRYDHVWSIFSDHYEMEYDEVQAFIKDMVEKHFKLRSLTPKFDTEYQ